MILNGSGEDICVENYLLVENSLDTNSASVMSLFSGGEFISTRFFWGSEFQLRYFFLLEHSAVGEL